ncbi:MAG: MarR family transcriptional regulator [Rhodoglobus sp.]
MGIPVVFAPTDGEMQAVIAAFAEMRAESVHSIEQLAGSLGVVPSDYRALFYVADNHDATPKAIAESLRLTTGAMTTLLDRIEAAGLVKRVAHPTDRRSIHLKITAKGQKGVDYGRARYTEAFVAAVPSEHRELIADVFTALARELREVGDSAGNITRQK